MKVAQILGDPNTSSKCYWSMVRKFPAFLLYFIMMNILSTFKKKWDFQFFFVDQRSPISNGSVSPSELPLCTDSTLSSCLFAKDDILWIINNLDPSKAHDKISILPMLKICGDSICNPRNIFKTCLHTGKFS